MSDVKVCDRYSDWDGKRYASIDYGTVCIGSIRAEEIPGFSRAIWEYNELIASMNRRVRHARNKAKWNCTGRVVPKHRCKVSPPFIYTVKIHKNAFWSDRISQFTPNKFASYSAAVDAALELQYH